MTTDTTVQRENLTLVEHGLFPIRIYANLTPAALIEHAVARGEGMLTDRGAFCAITTPAHRIVRIVMNPPSCYCAAGKIAIRSPRKDPTQISFRIWTATVPAPNSGLFG